MPRYLFDNKDLEQHLTRLKIRVSAVQWTANRLRPVLALTSFGVVDSVHAFVPPVLFGVSGFDALEVDAEP